MPHQNGDSKSHSLEVVSNAQQQADAGLERRRLPRLSLSAEQFRLASNGKIFSVMDISKDGFAIRVIEHDDLLAFPIGSDITGTLNLRREKYPVRARIRRISPESVGCQFEGLDAPVTEAIHRFLDPANLGSELKPMPASADGALWYHGPSGTDLLMWRGTDGDYRKMTLFLLGSYVQWSQADGLSTGRAEPSPKPQQNESNGIVRLETMWLRPDDRKDTGKLNIAKTLILSSNLPQDLKKWCVRQLQG